MRIINLKAGVGLAATALLVLATSLLSPLRLLQAKSEPEDSLAGQSGVRPTAGGPVITPPAATLGFTPGASRELAGWEQLLSYYRQVDRQSDRLTLREIGRTALGRPLVTLTISTAADPVRPVILLSAGLDPTAVGGTLTLTRLLHHLLTDRSPEVTRILARTTIIIIPSLNPDGLSMVTDWYRRTLGTPAEGSLPPEPVHHYAGDELEHDWHTLTQPETRAIVDKVFRQWDPQIWFDLRQKANLPALPAPGRLSLALRPAGPVPVQPGQAIRRALSQAGQPAVPIDRIPATAIWPPFFNGLGLRFTTASARLATPISSGPSRPPVTLAEIVDHQFTATIALLVEAADNHTRYLDHSGSRPAITAPRPSPVAYLLPEPPLPSSISETYQRLATELRQAAAGEEEERHERSTQLLGAATSQPSTSREVAYFYRTEGLDRLLAILRRGGVEVRRADEPFVAAGRSWPAGTHLVRMDQPAASFAATILDSHAPHLAENLPRLLNVEVVGVRQEFTVASRPEPAALVIQDRVRENGGIRVGIYRHRSAPADEGWMRWVFDQYRFGYSTLDDRQLRAGELAARFDAIIMPDQPIGPDQPAGRGATGPPDPASGSATKVDEGLGRDGIAALRQFVEAGGTLLAFNRASELAINAFRLPVRNVLARGSLTGVGAVLRVRVATDHQLSFGMEPEAAVWFENGPAFEILDPTRARSVAAYPTGPTGGPLLLHGALPRPGRWRGRDALVEVAVGRGRVVLFGFRPHYRGRSLVTYPFIFNVLMTSGRS